MGMVFHLSSLYRHDHSVHKRDTPSMMMIYDDIFNYHKVLNNEVAINNFFHFIIENEVKVI